MIEIYLTGLFHTLVKFLYAPLIFPKMFWILIPVIMVILLMEMYFWRYPRLNLEFHKSMENTIFLLFISFDLLRYVSMDGYHNAVKIYLCIGFVIFNVIIALLDFYHKLPLSLIGKLSSKLVVAYFSYIILVLIYSDMLDVYSVLSLVYILLSVIIFFLIILIVRKIFTILEPKSYEEIESFLNVIEKDLKKAIDESKEEIKEDTKASEEIRKPKKISKKTKKQHHPK
jgi:hypothetical protein